jgi:ABC-type polysaccharide/polyol phosphate transport system ATPase subunit
MVLASHDPHIVEKLCNVVVKLEHGEIVDVSRTAA